MNLLLLVYSGVGLLLAGLAIPLIREQIPPNYIYGFRFRRTLQDASIWYPANAYGGRLLLRYGIGVCLAANGFYLLPGLNEDRYALVLSAVLLGGIGLVTWKTLRYIGEL